MINPDVVIEDDYHRIEIRGGMSYPQRGLLGKGIIFASPYRHVDIEIYEHYDFERSPKLIDEMHFEQDETDCTLFTVEPFAHVCIYEFTFPDGFKLYMHGDSEQELYSQSQQYPLPIYDGT